MYASLKTLLSSIVDYAGLFPPAQLNMQQAIANYARDKMSPDSWMLERFVLPASRIDEFEEIIATFSLEKRSLSVILSGNIELELERIQSISDGGKIAIAALEFPPLPPTDIESIFPNLSAGVDKFFEIPPDADLEAYLSALQYTGAFAKIRTGGVTAEAFPSKTHLSHYIIAFAEAQIPFKATAGLHHPLLGEYRLTYESQSDSARMYGFLNVAILAALAYWQKTTQEEAIALLGESSLDNFIFTEDSIRWRDRILTLSEIETARKNFFKSFGSCSFQEPINDLKQLKLLN
ncbi:MAG: hypothetical protein MUD14_09255 [Hydrococcus sp. Prado102]|jgi:hypothetical protein|nr:hypothetical protein [Hydrococcus sp. Prado102]